MAIAATGLGSGLDIEGLVTQLVSAERMPLERRIFRDERKITSDISALGNLKSALSDLDTSVQAVSASATYTKKNVSTSDSTKLSATATDAVSVGSYDVEITNLAAAQSLALRA